MNVSFSQTALSAMVLMMCAPLAAQSFEDIEALAEQTTTEEQGIATANKQTEQGALLEALATLERVLTKFPNSAEARFNHAMLLCWIDDPQGAQVEFKRLDEKDYAPDTLKQAMANCRKTTQEGEQ